SDVCAEWLAQHSSPSKAPKASQSAAKGLYGPRNFPFVCSGTFIGRAASLRRVLRRTLKLYAQTKEYNDQALIAVLLLQRPSLGFVDSSAELFLGLHGHDEFLDLERPLCRGSYFEREKPATTTAKPAQEASGPMPEYTAVRSFRGLLPPRLQRSKAGPPSVMHFNGNGK
ncbi:unnamed protein product, partial [Symbiodinium pilosum]